MKKLILFLCALVFILPMEIDLYAQPEQAANLSSPASMGSAAYHVRYMEAGRDDGAFLKAVNYSPQEEESEDSPATKIGNGVVNTATFWTEVPKQVTEVSQENDILLGATWGFGKGMVDGFTRGASGVYDLSTCGLPPYNEPLVKPAYKVQHPQEDGFKVNLLKW